MNTFKRILDLPLNQSFFLFGPRQVGKTTLIKDKFNDQSLFFNLLDRQVLLRLQRNPNVFREEIFSRDKNIKHIVIDEIQKFPTLLDDVQYLMTEEKKSLYFVMTGSSARKLKRSGINLLGGRAWNLSLSSLTHLEILANKDFGGIKFPLLKILKYGSLPEVLLTQKKESEMLLRSYVSTYIEEEIIKESLVRNLNAFHGFLELAAIENGQIINFSNIASDIGVSHTTIQEYYQILEDTLMGFFLRPYTKSDRKRLTKHPKFYFFDLGVKSALSNTLLLPIESHRDSLGKAFEHFIIREILTLSKYKFNDFKFSFYRTQSGVEVDLIIETPEKNIWAIEIKSGNQILSKDLNGLRSFKEIRNDAKLVCVDMNAQNQRYIDDILVCPWKTFFSILGLSF